MNCCYIIILQRSIIRCIFFLQSISLMCYHISAGEFHTITSIADPAQVDAPDLLQPNAIRDGKDSQVSEGRQLPHRQEASKQKSSSAAA